MCSPVRLGMMILMISALFATPSSSRAASFTRAGLAGSPIDLVNAVNALRASFGLPPYGINPILMATAQAQADYLASTGTMTHAGPGGIGLTERLLAAGYPLAGDLSLGGFRAENITGGDLDMPAEAAVDHWTGDALHLNTMVSPDLTEIGAGVAIRGERVIYVIDAARPTSAADLPVPATSIAGGTSVAGSGISPEIIIPISVSTPNADGNVFHEVRFGQTLWQIAITYETTIDEIKRLNNLLDNNIYPGNMLLIRTGLLAPSATPPASPLPAFTPTSSPTGTPAASTGVAGATPVRASPVAPQANARLTYALLGIILLAIVGGGIFTVLGGSKKP